MPPIPAEKGTATKDAGATAVTSSDDKPKIILYWLNQSRAQRTLWLLEELKLPHELQIFHRDPATKFAPPELKAIHPLGKSPIISIAPANAGPDTKPVILAESSVISEYLLDHFGKNTTLVPQQWREGHEGKVGGETESWLRYKYLIQYTEGSFMPYLVTGLLAKNIKDSPVPFFIKPITSMISGKLHNLYIDPNLEAHFSFLENQLKTSPDNGSYLCGPHLTGADILLSFPLIASRNRQTWSESKYPLLYKYAARLEEEPGYLSAKEEIVKIEGSFDPNF